MGRPRTEPSPSLFTSPDHMYRKFHKNIVFLNKRPSKKSGESDAGLGLVTGQGALALAFLVGGTAILAALALAFFTASFTNTIYGFQAANRALAAASAGASDALRELSRDKDFTAPLGYPMQVGGIDVRVIVEPVVGQSGVVRITSQASSFGFVRKLQVIASVHQTTGEVTSISWQQLAV